MRSVQLPPHAYVVGGAASLHGIICHRQKTKQGAKPLSNVRCSVFVLGNTVRLGLALTVFLFFFVSLSFSFFFSAAGGNTLRLNRKNAQKIAAEHHLVFVLGSTIQSRAYHGTIGRDGTGRNGIRQGEYIR